LGSYSNYSVIYNFLIFSLISTPKIRSKITQSVLAELPVFPDLVPEVLKHLLAADVLTLVLPGVDQPLLGHQQLLVRELQLLALHVHFLRKTRFFLLFFTQHVRYF
jgi:hypothetical protein